MTLPKVRTDIPPAYHPNVARGDYLTRPDNENFLNKAQDALALAYETWASLNDGDASVENKKLLAKRASQETDRVLPQLDRARRELIAERDKRSTAIAQTLRPDDEPKTASEIRAFLRGQPKPVNRALQLVRSGDLQSAQAILSGPGYLSGLDAEQYQLIEDAATRQFCDADRGLIEDLNQSLSSLESAGSALVAHYGQLAERWDAPAPDQDERDKETLDKVF